jgi:hypothetical protein
MVVTRVGRDGFSVGWSIGRSGLTCVDEASVSRERRIGRQMRRARRVKRATVMDAVWLVVHGGRPELSLMARQQTHGNRASRKRESAQCCRGRDRRNLPSLKTRAVTVRRRQALSERQGGRGWKCA